MVSVVVDTNVLVALVIARGTMAKELFSLWDTKKVSLLYCAETYAELDSVLGYKKLSRYLSGDVRDKILNKLLLSGKEVIVTSSLSLCRDPKDDIFINLAISGGAQYLVTGDLDLLSVTKSLPFTIVSPATFVGLFK